MHVSQNSLVKGFENSNSRLPKYNTFLLRRGGKNFRGRMQKNDE